MKIIIVTPAPPGSRLGNRITALRWSRLLRELGHQVQIRTGFRDETADLLIALHARRSAAAVRKFRARYPDRPILVALTGTDLYRDITSSTAAKSSLTSANRLIVLQPLGIEELPAHLRSKVRVILQSVEPPPFRPVRSNSGFNVCVLGHLRPVKDPFRTAYASRLLPAESRIRIIHVGKALHRAMEARARKEMVINPRYRWLGELSRAKALRVLTGCHLLAVTSLIEGGANAVSEAIVCGVPVVASAISGSLGMLGNDYAGYFPTGDTQALAHLLYRAEQDSDFYAQLLRQCRKLVPNFSTKTERRAWRKLLRELILSDSPNRSEG